MTRIEGVAGGRPRITPCLWFDDQGADAAQVYVSVFPDSRVTDVSRYGPNGPGPEGQVMTVAFELSGLPFVALNGGPLYRFTEAVSFQVGCDSQDEVDHYWGRLCDGGEEGPCGWLKDRFGLSWQIVPHRLTELLADPDQARAARAMAAMLQMKKIDIAALERAAAAG